MRVELGQGGRGQHAETLLGEGASLYTVQRIENGNFHTTDL